MMFSKITILLLGFISIGIYKLTQLEVDSSDFRCQYQKQIKANPESIFRFLTTPYALEKLLPWLMKFKEADKRIISPGKWYSATIGIPIIGEKTIYANLTDYKPMKLMVFEFNDNYLKQKIIIRTSNYHNRTLLKIIIFLNRTSLLYQYTIGYLLRIQFQNQLEKSMKNVAAIIENLVQPNEFSDI